MGLYDAGAMGAQINGNRAKKKFAKQQAEAARAAQAQAAEHAAEQARQAAQASQRAQSASQLLAKYHADVLAQMTYQSQTLTEIRDLLISQASVGASSPSGP